MQKIALSTLLFISLLLSKQQFFDEDVECQEFENRCYESEEEITEEEKEILDYYFKMPNFYWEYELNEVEEEVEPLEV